MAISTGHGLVPGIEKALYENVMTQSDYERIRRREESRKKQLEQAKLAESRRQALPITNITTKLPITQIPINKVGELSSYLSQVEYKPEDYLSAETEAIRGVEQEFSGAQARELRELGRLGISPTSGRARSSRERRALNLALARSGARLEARKRIDELNLARETSAREQALSLRGQDITQRGQEVSASIAREEMRSKEKIQASSQLASQKYGLPTMKFRIR